MKGLFIAARIVHGFVGIGALVGGGAAILNPNSPLGIPPDSLEGSLFTNYLIPGIILFTVLGFGDLFALFLSCKFPKTQAYSGCTMGGALMIWIIVQCIILGSIVFLHVFFFAVGGVLVLLSLIIMYRNRQFPVNQIMGFFQKRKYHG
ncbi:MAG: hypothetical protein H8D65_02560 [Spirochaetes bacterium]|nr:hypothetical protein [Spirochaetota bacterium]MBL7005642.1 hypothetical protein [Spirochaetia bacterium]